MTNDDARPVTRIVLVRHGESIVTVERVIGGVRTCTGLSDLGRDQTERLRARVHSEVAAGVFDVDVLLSSDFPRAIQTAEILQPALGGELATAPFERRAGFGEHDPGPEIDGMTFDAYVERFGTPEWGGDPHLEIFPGGETTFVFHQRVQLAIDALIDQYEGLSMMIACHGGVVDAAFRHLLDLPMTGLFELHTLNTSITEFVSTASGWRLARYNDAAHLAGLADRTRTGDRVASE